MTGPTTPSLTAPSVPAQYAPTSRPPPERRVIEETDGAGSARVAADDPKHVQSQDLTESARKFAALIQATGNVRLAAALSGLPLDSVDTYA